MGPTCKSYVLELLENSSHRLRQIELMRYELQHIPQVSDSEMIEAMSLPSLTSGEKVADSKAVPDAALSYKRTAERMNAETLEELASAYMDLWQEHDRLLHYVGLLDERQGRVPKGEFMMVAGHLQIKNEKYYMVLELRNEQGKRKTKWIGTGLAVKGNKRRAEAMLEETRARYFSSVVNDKAQMPFVEYMSYWLEIVRPNLEENTYAGYKSNIEKRIAPFFKQSGITLGEIKAAQIQEFYTYCQTVLHVSNNTVIHYHANLTSAFRYALKMDYIRVNPMNRVKKPKLIQHNANFYSAEETEMLIAAVHGDTIEFPVMMAAYYGLRRSEIAGLRWKAIDFTSNRITIEHTVTQALIEGERKIIAKDRAKNKSSCRSLPLMPQFKMILLQMKKQQDDNRKLCGNCYHESEYVYVNPLGVPYMPDFITDHFRNYLMKAGFRKITFHELRHSCASMLLKQGVGMKDIQAWLGHSTYNTTANLYAHLDSESKVGVGTVMENLLDLSSALETV